VSDFFTPWLLTKTWKQAEDHECGGARVHSGEACEAAERGCIGAPGGSRESRLE